MTPKWLPGLVSLEDYGGNWERYLEALYEFFKQDFSAATPVFRGNRISLKRHPISKGKEATFWHLISEGVSEDDRTIDLRRCERIRWPKPVIENSFDECIKFWKNFRKRESRICLWLYKQDYLVVLAERKGYLLLWTAYLVTLPHMKRKLQKEFDNFWKEEALKS